MCPVAYFSLHIHKMAIYLNMERPLSRIYVERILFGSALQGSLIIKVLFDFIYVYTVRTHSLTHTPMYFYFVLSFFKFCSDFMLKKVIIIIIFPLPV